MPSLRSLFGKKDKAPAPAQSQDIEIDPGEPAFSVGSGEKTSRFSQMASGLRDVMARANQVTTSATRAVTNTVDRATTAVSNRVDQATNAINTQVDNLTSGASNLVSQAGQKVTGATDAVGDFASNTVKPAASLGAKIGGGFLAGSVAGYFEKKNEKREANAENRFRAANAEMIAALSQPPADSISDRPGVRARLEQDIARNSHGHPRISSDEAVQMARMGQHIAEALANGAELNENGKLPVEVNGKVYEVPPGGFASRALAWHMTAVAANNTELRQQQNPGQDVADDMTNSGSFSMKDPGGRIYNFLNANPQVQGRMSTHFEDRLDNDRKIFNGQKTVQRGYDDYQGKLPGQGGALLFDKMKNGELFVKVEHAGCPGIFAREGHHTPKDIAVRAPLALNRWFQHSVSFKDSMNTSAALDPNKITRQEAIDKGKLKTTVNDPLLDALAMAEAAGAITARESVKLYDGARKQGLQQVEKVTNFLQGVADGLQSPGFKNLLQAKLDEVNQGVRNARQELDSLEQIPELELGGIDRRGAEVHVNLDPSKNPANLPGAQMPPAVDDDGNPALGGPGDDDGLPGPDQGQQQPDPGLDMGDGLPGPDQGQQQPVPVLDAGEELPGEGQGPEQPAQDQDVGEGLSGAGQGQDQPAQGNDAGEGLPDAGQGQDPPGPDLNALQQPEAPGPKITHVKELQKGMKGVVFRVDYDDNTSKVVKLQTESAAKAIIGTQIVQQAGINAPRIENLGGNDQPGRNNLANQIKAAGLGEDKGAADAGKLARFLEGDRLPVAVVMDFAEGMEIGAALKQPGAENVLNNPRFQEQLGALMAADAFSGNSDRVMAIQDSQDPSGLSGWYNPGNLKISGAGDDLNIVAIDNEFNPGMNLRQADFSDSSAFGLKGVGSPIQIGSMAAASPELLEKEARVVAQKLAADAGVKLSAEQLDAFVQNVGQGASQAMGALMQPGQQRQKQFEGLGAGKQELDDFAKHKRALRMLGQEGPAEGAKPLSVREKMALAAGSDKEHKQGYRQFMGKASVAGDLPEISSEPKPAVQASGRNRVRQIT